MVDSSLFRLGYRLNSSLLRNHIYVPRYYEPDIQAELRELGETHQLVSIGELVAKKHVILATGHEVGKMAYGTGTIPFVRTSDISNWEIKTDPKQGVSREIYEQYSARQDVRAGDILFVRDGTYLVGQSCIVTRHDLPLLIQSHIFRLRVNQTSPISNWLLFAAINTPIVKRQIRAMQFTADIIDTIGNRILELILPIPLDANLVSRITDGMQDVMDGRNRLREKIRRIPLLAQGAIQTIEEDLVEIKDPDALSGNTGFRIPASRIKSNIYVPKYYDTLLQQDLQSIATTHELIPISALIRSKSLSWESGIEVGKMAYGTGSIPFVRTSDISNWELKSDPKQSVSEEIYEQNKQSVESEDVFIVSDGTYLIGTTCMVMEGETKILYCGGIDRLRSLDKNRLSPFLLLALLNTPIVKRQIRSKQFTRDIIDTLSRRLLEIVLPIPRDNAATAEIIQQTQEVLEQRIYLKRRATELTLLMQGKLTSADLEVLE